MFNSQCPRPEDLPTSRQLIRATALAVNVLLMTAGFVLVGYQLAGYAIS